MTQVVHGWDLSELYAGIEGAIHGLEGEVTIKFEVQVVV
jgi:hypothetical protein